MSPPRAGHRSSRCAPGGSSARDTTRSSTDTSSGSTPEHSPLSYFYAHLLRPAEARAGDAVKTSERLGKIGLTGNAAGTPCHLHVELRRSGRLLDPEPRLARWDRYG